MNPSSGTPLLDESEPGPVLAIDYGRKRVGIAVSDALRLTVRPVAIIDRRNRADLFHRLRLTARELHARHIIVGCPLNLDGSVSEMTLEARSFATRLQKELGIPVQLVDERLTSWAAQSAPPSSSKPARSLANNRAANSANSKDDLAAAILLQDYLDTARPHPFTRHPEGK